MADSNFPALSIDSESGDHSIINGLAGVAAAVVTEEMLSHTPIGRAAGLVAASVGGLVVYGLDHTDVGKRIGQVLSSTDDPMAIMPNCLPQTDILQEAINLMSRPFDHKPTISPDNGPASSFEPTSSISFAQPVSERSGDAFAHSVLLDTTSMAAAHSIVDNLAHRGEIVCDPPQSSDTDIPNIVPCELSGTPNDIV